VRHATSQKGGLESVGHRARIRRTSDELGDRLHQHGGELVPPLDGVAVTLAGHGGVELDVVVNVKGDHVSFLGVGASGEEWGRMSYLMPAGGRFAPPWRLGDLSACGALFTVELHVGLRDSLVIRHLLFVHRVEPARVSVTVARRKRRVSERRAEVDQTRRKNNLTLTSHTTVVDDIELHLSSFV